MQKGLALVPGLLFAAGISTACRQDAPAESPDPELCYAEVTPISAVQGDGYHSPVQGEHRRVSGAITHIDLDTGYFLEQSGDGMPGQASRALFVEKHDAIGDIQIGQHAVVGGLIEERGERRDKLTTLVDIDEFALCKSSLPLPLTRAQLPLSNAEREALEGMRVLFEQELFVSDVYLHNRGIVALSPENGMMVPTEHMRPGQAADRQAQDNRKNAVNVSEAGLETNAIAAGSRFKFVSGVMGHDGRAQVLLLAPGEVAARAVPTALQPPQPGTLRVVNSNLLNYFNGDGQGGGFPNERGARTQQDLARQEDRMRSAMAQIRPDVLAVQELENDGFGFDSAAQSLVTLLDDMGNGKYAVVRAPGARLGNDVITVGLFYRKQAVEPIGPAHTLDSGPFRELSRQPLVQAFRDRASGAMFLVVSNHLKSKGSCPDSGPNNRQKDGQGCWNEARVEAVEALLPWLEQLAGETGTEHLLILGDMNAYRMEDPVQAFKKHGYSELVEQLSGLPQYSYRYFGQVGTLDYAFASDALVDSVQQARIWHINSDWPQKMELPEPWLRMSDHDPVIVDIKFREMP